MKKEVLSVKAFTKDQAQGNPAGVILQAQGLDKAQMISIAAQIGFSESAFVFPSETADFHVRFFTPTQEVDLCGHATIATFHSLLSQNRIKIKKDSLVLTQQTRAGLLEVKLHSDGLVVMSQTEPTFFEPKSDRNTIAKLLSLDESSFLGYPIQAVSTGGAPKLMIPIRSIELLHSIRPDFNNIAEYCRTSEVRGFYPFTSEVIEKGSDFHARQFNPLAGIDEDPITGIAAGALACYSQKYGIISKRQFVIEQGFIMNRGGKMMVSLEGGVFVGGYGVIFDRQTVEVT